MQEPNKNYIIICDFDGTISVKDVNTSIFEYFGGEEAKTIENKYRNSEIGLRESLATQYEIIRVDNKSFESYVYDAMEIDESFFNLYDYAKEIGIEVVILSGGFENYINILFEKYGHKSDIRIHSNRLEIRNNHMSAVYSDVPKCNKYYGPCGLCKQRYIKEYKKLFNVIYVGDGFTDRCAAECADIVFAKDNLEKYCRENNLPYLKYTSFKEIEDYIKKYIQ